MLFHTFIKKYISVLTSFIFPQPLLYTELKELPQTTCIYPYHYTLFCYQDHRVKSCIKYLKHHRDIVFYESIADLIIKKHYHLFTENKTWLLVPVPQSKQRAKERGFNPTEVLAKLLSKKTNQPVIKKSVITKRDTRKQALLKKAERSNNIKNAFTLHDRKQIHAKNIIIIDDLVTTGATTAELARTIYRGNACHVIFLSIAH